MSKTHAIGDPLARGTPEPSLFNPAPVATAPPPPRFVYGGLPPAQKTSDTSRAAAARMASRAPSLRMMILELVRAKGDEGLTGEEAGSHLAVLKGLPADTTATRLTGGARLTELRLGGYVADSGRRRKTRAGCNSIVFVATAKQGDGRVCERLTPASNNQATLPDNR